MDFGRVVRGVEAERLHVEPSGGGEQRIGGDNAVALRANEPRACRSEVLLGVEHVERGALAALRLPLHPGEGDGGGAYLGLRGRERDLRPFVARRQAPITAAWV